MIRFGLNVALLMSLAAAPMLAGTVVIDEFANAVINGLELSGSGFLSNDPGPGGQLNVLTYNLPFAGVQGDVQMTDGGVVNDVLRFNGNFTVIFYSDNQPVADALGDTLRPPTSFYTNLVSLPEVGDEFFSQAVYTPVDGNPGADASSPTYTFISEGSAAPEPASWTLLVAGLGALGYRRLRKRGARG